MPTATVRAVTLIHPMVTRLPSKITSVNAVKRVAAYARVSTNTEEQLSSYEAQVDYYTRYITDKVGWDLVEVYTDEGISATSTKKRDGFKRMIADALDDKIDMIITKSVSRFARNTVDTLTTVRKLKEKGVEVYFVKNHVPIKYRSLSLQKAHYRGLSRALPLRIVERNTALFHRFKHQINTKNQAAS